MAMHAPDSLAADVMRRTAQLKTDRTTLDAHLQDIRDYIRPDSAHFTGGPQKEGTKDRPLILDNTTEDASEDLSSAIHGFLTNPATAWFGLTTDRELLRRNSDIARALEEATRIMLRVFHAPRAGFTSQLGDVYGSVLDFGTGCLFAGDRPGKLPLFTSRQLAQIFAMQDADGTIDAVHRPFKLEARRAVQQFGEDMMGAKFVLAAEKEPLRKLDFEHAVFPANDVGPMREARGKDFASVYVFADEKRVVQRGGFEEMPYIVPRWTRRAGETYGRGRGQVALPDTKMLQRVMKATIRAAELSIKPSLQVADDGVLGPIRMGEHGINFVRSELLGARHEAIKPINTGARADIGEDTAEGIRERIRRIYFNDRLSLPRGTGFKATHIIELVEEGLRVLGPYLGTLQNELLGPLIVRTFGILWRAGAFRQLESVLDGVPITVEYVSPLAKAQRLSEVTALNRLMETSVPLQAANPDVYDNLDTDKAFRHSTERLGVPLDLLVDERQVAARRKAKQQETARQAALEQAGQAAGAAQSAGQAAAAFSGAAANAA